MKKQQIRKRKNPREIIISFRKYYKKHKLDEEKILNKFKDAYNSIPLGSSDWMSYNILLDLEGVPEEAMSLDFKNKMGLMIISRNPSKDLFRRIDIINGVYIDDYYTGEDTNESIRGRLIDVIYEIFLEWYHRGEVLERY